MLGELRQLWSSSIDEWEALEESLDYLRAKGTLTSLVEDDVDSLARFLSSHKECSDVFTLKVFPGNGDSLEFSNGTSDGDVKDRLDKLIDEIEDFEGGEVSSIELEIHKKVSHPGKGVLIDNIYTLEAFSEYLKAKPLFQVHKELVQRYGKQEASAVVFLGDFECSHHTEFFYFIPKGKFVLDSFKPKLQQTDAEEAKRIRGTLGHFANASEWPFLPGSFKFTKSSPNEFVAISSLFNGLHNVYLVSFFANLTTIGTKSINFQLKGLKDISGTYSVDYLINTDAKCLWALYKWVYASNSVDKMGVTRNIIPLHVEDLLSVDEPVLASSYSSFILSQKSDVKNYIEATGKLADQVQVTTQKSSEVAEKVANSIKTGVFGITTFAISTILFRIFSKGGDIDSYSDLFAFIGSPLFVSMIAFALTVFTALFGLAIFESYQDQERFKEMYYQSKKVHENVFTAGDMKYMLSDDAYYKKNYEFISDRRAAYCWVWFGVLSLVITTLILAYCHAQSLAG